MYGFSFPNVGATPLNGLNYFCDFKPRKWRNFAPLNFKQHSVKVRSLGAGAQICAAKPGRVTSLILRSFPQNCGGIIQLIIGNIQTENKPLEIGLNALELVVKDSKKGLSAAAYGEKIGIENKTIRNYLNAAEVYIFVKSQSEAGFRLLEDIYKLIEIHKCTQADWLWFYDLIIGWPRGWRWRSR